MAKIRIVLADDHVILRQGTRQLLEHEPDIEVVGEASDGAEAVELVSKLKPDIVIIDVAMPHMNGIEATKKIKEILPGTKILVLTGYDYDEYIFSLLEIGAAGYLLKDVSGDDLVGAVRAVYQGEPVLHPTVMRKLMNRFKTPTTRQTETPIDVLSEREMEVLKLAVSGKSNKDIADALNISLRTVQAHMRSIFNKLGVGSRSEAIVSGLKKGWFSLEDIS
jgi:Response regulator containing a CheY-like receiver domain and an HTH DNA-binding domain